MYRISPPRPDAGNDGNRALRWHTADLARVQDAQASVIADMNNRLAALEPAPTVSHFTLEDGSGVLLLEDGSGSLALE